MSRKLAVLTVSIGIFGGTLALAQNVPPGTVPPGANPYYLYPGSSQPVPMLVTPTARFDSPPPTAGISDAGRAGISANNPLSTGVTSTLGPSTMVYTTIQGETFVTPNVAPVPSAGPGGGRLINDMGPSYYSDVLPAASTVSLGEVAAQFKASRAAVNARMLTNDDVSKMVSSQTGVTMAKNMPPLGPGVSGLVGQPPRAVAQPGPKQNAPPSGPQSRTGTPPPAQGQTEAGATTPQIQNQQSNDAQGKGRLPATSTWLPLLGLLGAVSGGIGLLFRRFRK